MFLSHCLLSSGLFFYVCAMLLPPWLTSSLYWHICGIWPLLCFGILVSAPQISFQQCMNWFWLFMQLLCHLFLFKLVLTCLCHHCNLWYHSKSWVFTHNDCFIFSACSFCYLKLSAQFVCQSFLNAELHSSCASFSILFLLLLNLPLSVCVLTNIALCYVNFYLFAFGILL